MRDQQLSQTEAIDLLSRVHTYLRERQYTLFTTQEDANAIMRARDLVLNALFAVKAEAKVSEVDA